MLNESGTDATFGVSPDRETAARNASMREGAAGRKHFVLDTNVLLHNAQSIFKFAEHEVVIPLAVIEELDTFKKNNDETGRNARTVTRALDRRTSLVCLLRHHILRLPDVHLVQG